MKIHHYKTDIFGHRPLGKGVLWKFLKFWNRISFGERNVGYVTQNLSSKLAVNQSFISAMISGEESILCTASRLISHLNLPNRLNGRAQCFLVT